MTNPEFSRQFVEDQIARRKGLFKEDEVNVVPNWIWKIGRFVAIEQSLLVKTESGSDKLSGLPGQLMDKFDVLSNSLRFGGEGDVEAFAALSESIVHFWPGMGFKKDDLYGKLGSVSSDAKLFMKTATEWVKSGVNPDLIGGWFKSVAGLICLDPTVGRFFSPQDLTREIQPIDGLNGFSSETRLEIKKRVERGELGEIRPNWTTLENIRVFSDACFKGLEDGGTLKEISRDAHMLATLIELIQEGNYRQLELLRPTPPEDVAVLVAVGLAEKLCSDSMGEQSCATTDIASGLTRMIRRRRMHLSFKSVSALCLAFKDNTVTNKGDSSGDPEQGWGLDLVKRIATDADKEQLGNIKSEISNKIIPDLVYELRVRGLSTFNWTSNHYQRLGFDSTLWEKHNKKLRDDLTLDKFPRRENVKKGDCVIEFSGQYQPFHHAHFLGAIDALGFSVEQLKSCGLVPEDFDGRVWVGMRVNSYNPKKHSKEKPEQPVEERWENVRQALRGSSERIFLYPPKDVNKPTHARLLAHSHWFTDHQRELDAHIRLVGTDTLSPEYLYSGKDSLLNFFPHIFNLQIAEVNNFQKLAEVIRTIFRNFGQNGVAVTLSSCTDIHSSGIRAVVKDVDDETLATLVHPGDVKRVRELYGDGH